MPVPTVANVRDLEAIVGAETGVDAIALDPKALTAYHSRLLARLPEVEADHAQARAWRPAPPPARPAPSGPDALEVAQQALAAAQAALAAATARG